MFVVGIGENPATHNSTVVGVPEKIKTSRASISASESGHLHSDAVYPQTLFLNEADLARRNLVGRLHQIQAGKSPREASAFQADTLLPSADHEKVDLSRQGPLGPDPAFQQLCVPLLLHRAEARSAEIQPCLLHAPGGSRRTYAHLRKRSGSHLHRHRQRQVAHRRVATSRRRTCRSHVRRTQRHPGSRVAAAGEDPPARCRRFSTARGFSRNRG